MDEAGDPSRIPDQPPSAVSPPTTTPAPPSRTSSQLEQSRWSTSTLSSVAPSLHRKPTRAEHQSLPPLPAATEPFSDAQLLGRSQTVVDKTIHHARNVSAPTASPSSTSKPPSRAPSQASVARSLSASSREIPIMLQIDEDAPPVPPLPNSQDSRPLSTVSNDPSVHSLPPISFAPPVPPVPPVPPLPTNDRSIRKTELQVPASTLSGPASAPLAPTSNSPRRPLHSKFYVGDDGAPRARSAASSPRIPPPSKTNTVSGPRPSPRIPRDEPTPRSFLNSPSRPSTSGSKASSLLSRMSTMKPTLFRDPSKYQKLDDGNEGEIQMDSMRDSNQPDSSADTAPVHIPMDISSFGGPDTFKDQPFHRSHTRKGSKGAVDGADILESKGQLTGGLGGGMGEVVEAQIAVPPNHQPSIAKRSGSRWMRRQQSALHPRAQAGQEAAERTGQVVAVDGSIGVDLSNVEGTAGVPMTSTDINLIADEASKQSYYFPPDPQMPNWRPLPMQPWYLVLLISIAITFAAVAEYLVQKSQNTPLLKFVDPEKDVSAGDWFVWKYLGEMLLVSYGVMFQATDFEVRRLEPYYQMSQPSGSKAEESLNMDYLTFWSYLIPFKAFRHRQWAVACSSISTILASAVVPVLYSAALNLNPDRDQRKPGTEMKVVMDPHWSRVMEATLYLIAISGALLLYQQRRKSGLAGDLKGIAGIATMATKSHILNDFRGLDLASHQTIHKQLAHRRYILHKGSLWQGEWITRNGAEEISLPKSKNPHPVALHLPIGMIFMFSLILFAALLPIFEFNGKANVVTDRANWFLPLLATLLKLSWTNLETGVRMIEPFYRLSHRHAPPRVLLLDYTGTIPGVMPIKASLNGHFILAAVGIGSLLLEVLTVCVSSFNVDGRTLLPGGNRESNDTGETARSYTISFVLAEMIPLILVIIGFFIYWRRRHPFLPRQPGTIASTLAFLHQSRMLYDFVADDDDDEDYNKSPTHSTLGNPISKLKSLSKAKTFATFMSASNSKSTETDVAERTVQTLELQKKTYGLGWYCGRDGQDHLGVDEEELQADYTHGVDWSKGHLGGEAPGAWETL